MNSLPNFQANSHAFVSELKTRARLLLPLLQAQNAAAIKRARILSRQHRWELPEAWQLRHCLNLVAADAGFDHWEHARQVLSGQAQVGDDVGDFWRVDEVGGYTNHWYASYADAKACLMQNRELFLLPYRKQFVLVSLDYLRTSGLDNDSGVWDELQHDLVQSYFSAAWQTLALQRLQKSRIDRFEKLWNVNRVLLEMQSTDAQKQRVMRSFVQDGRLLKIPEQRKKRLVILQWLCDQLEPERRYPEPELNQFFLRFHEDFASLRREMIVNALMARADGVYWRIMPATPA